MDNNGRVGVTLSPSGSISPAGSRKGTKFVGRAPIPALTSLRFFAAFGVLLFHSGSSAATAAGNFPRPVLNFLENGYLGVSFFFILSGFILTYVYDSFAAPGSFGKFYRARVARIYPVYLLCLLLILPVLPPGNVSWRAIPQLLLLQSWPPPHFLTFENWNGQAWTLSVEISFYILFPFLLATIKRLSVGGLAALTFAAVAAILVGRLSYVSGEETLLWPELKYVPLPFLRLPEFVYGVCLALMFLNGGRLRKPHWASHLSVGLTIAVMASSNSPWVAPAASICFGLVIYAFAAQSGLSGLSAALSSLPLVLLGSASYSLYLLEAPVREWMRVLFSGHWENFGRLTYPFALVLLSIAIFKAFEEPARRLSRRFGQTASPVAARSLNAILAGGRPADQNE